ncbi:unnamed protein product [Amoebophrya sp. A120]|nr:unnamed protein product [Amoebophrya sp. A120]|eukprot:GSA120T00018722001.1
MVASLIERRAKDVERFLRVPHAKDCSSRLQRSGDILLSKEDRKEIGRWAYPRIDIARYVLLEDFQEKNRRRKELLQTVERKLKRRQEIQKERSRQRVRGLGVEPKRNPPEPWEPYYDISKRDAWLYDRKFAAMASTRSPRKPQPTVDLDFRKGIRPRTTPAPNLPRYTDLSLDWGPGRSVLERISRSSSPDRWQQSPRYDHIPEPKKEYEREPIPRKFLWTKEQALVGRLASWTADEARDFWRSWVDQSAMAKEGVSKAGKKDALARAKAQREKYGGLTIEKAQIVVKSLSSRPEEKLSSQEIELLGRAKQFLSDQKGGSSFGEDIDDGLPKAWDDRCCTRVASLGNAERHKSKRSLFLNYSVQPEKYMDKMLGTLIRDDLRLTEEEQAEKNDFLKKTGLAAAKKAEREAAKSANKGK